MGPPAPCPPLQATPMEEEDEALPDTLTRPGSANAEPAGPSATGRKRSRPGDAGLSLGTLGEEDEEEEQGGLGRAIKKGFRKWLKTHRGNLSRETRALYCQLAASTVRDAWDKLGYTQRSPESGLREMEEVRPSSLTTMPKILRLSGMRVGR